MIPVLFVLMAVLTALQFGAAVILGGVTMWAWACASAAILVGSVVAQVYLGRVR